MVLGMIFQLNMFVGAVKYEKNVKHFYSSTEKAFLWSMWYTAHNVVVDKILPLDLKASGFCTRQCVADKKGGNHCLMI